MTQENKEQQHPQYNRDRPLLEGLLVGEASNYNLVELARLRIRYHNFPGARDIQRGLDEVLDKWGITEAELFQKTRAIHAVGGIYRTKGNKEEQDWN
ncbi:MAG: DUF3288 family protein [Nostocales cyanobacterium 94392]|nr:DUF3288 family protein [Nostocales cyanobacterium 94392]